MKSLDDWLYLFAFFLMLIGIAIGSVYFILNEHDECVSDPLSYKFNIEFENYTSSLYAYNYVALCGFRSSSDIIPDRCIKFKNNK